jgi:hypothetical protein
MAKFGRGNNGKIWQKIFLKKCKKGVDILPKMSIILSVDGRKPPRRTLKTESKKVEKVFKKVLTTPRKRGRMNHRI